MLYYGTTGYYNYKAPTDNEIFENFELIIPTKESTELDMKVYQDHSLNSLVIHQSYDLKKTMPKLYIEWSNSWKKNHKNWAYHLWSDEDNRNLIKHYYPWFLETYDLFHRKIFQIDSVRYLYMHRYGGVYSDLDAESLKPLDVFFFNKDSQPVVSSIQNRKIILAYMGENRYFRHGIPNAFLGATAPGDPFWLFVVREIMNDYLYYKNAFLPQIPVFAEYLTGPIRLYESLKKYELLYPILYKKNFKFLNSSVIFPYDWMNSNGKEIYCSGRSKIRNKEKCKSNFPDAFAINYWSHIWEESVFQPKGTKYTDINDNN